MSLNIRCVLLSAAETLDKYHARQYPAGGCGEVSCAALRLPPPAAGAAHLPAPQMDLQHPRLLCSPLFVILIFVYLIYDVIAKNYT